MPQIRKILNIRRIDNIKKFNLSLTTFPLDTYTYLMSSGLVKSQDIKKPIGFIEVCISIFDQWVKNCDVPESGAKNDFACTIERSDASCNESNRLFSWRNDVSQEKELD